MKFYAMSVVLCLSYMFSSTAQTLQMNNIKSTNTRVQMINSNQVSARNQNTALQQQTLTKLIYKRNYSSDGLAADDCTKAGGRWIPHTVKIPSGGSYNGGICMDVGGNKGCFYTCNGSGVVGTKGNQVVSNNPNGVHCSDNFGRACALGKNK